MIAFLAYLIGFVCFVLAAFSVTVSRVNLVALGLAAFILPSLTGAWP